MTTTPGMPGPERDLTLPATAECGAIDRRALVLADLCREAAGRLRALCAALKDDRDQPLPVALLLRLRAELMPDLRRLTEALSPAVVEPWA